MKQESNDDVLINKYLKNTIDKNELANFKLRLKDGKFRNDFMLAKILQLGTQNPMEKALNTYAKIKDSINENDIIKLTQEDAEFIASINSNKGKEKLKEYFEPAELFENFANKENFDDWELIGGERNRSTSQKANEQTNTFQLNAPSNYDNFSDKINIQLQNPIHQDIQIFIFDNLRDHPETIENDLPFILPKNKSEITIDVSKLEPGRYYIKLEANSYKNVMQVVWVL